MALLPETDGPAAILAGIVGFGLFVWRFFWGAKKDVRRDGAEGMQSQAYEDVISALRAENERLRLRKDEAEGKLHDSRNECAKLAMDNYKLNSDLERLKLIINVSGHSEPPKGSD